MGRGIRDSKIKISENECVENNNERSGRAGERERMWLGTCGG